MFKRKSLLMLVLAAVLVVAFVAGCAEQRPERSYVQQYPIKKSWLDGYWYYKVTVIDHPYEAKWTFIGEEGFQLEKIRWVIDENYLYAYRAYETIMNTEKGNCVKAGTKIEDLETMDTSTLKTCYQDNECDPGNFCLKNSKKYFGAPIAAYRILSHFDIQRQYNPTTGEEINVIVENTTDRLWWDREYIRVDWSQNLMFDWFHFILEYIDPMYAYMKKEPVPFWDQQQSIITPEQGYLDIVNAEIVSPTPNSLWYEYSYPVVLSQVPVTFRHSFLKVRPSTYEPSNFPDLFFDIGFGYFRLDRESYDNHWGLNEISRNYNISRWNIFKQWRDESGNLMKIRDREIKKIVYYMNEDMPEVFKWPSYLLVRDWDVAFRKALRSMVATEYMLEGKDRNEADVLAKDWVEKRIDRSANKGLGALVFELRENYHCDETYQSAMLQKIADTLGKKVEELSTEERQSPDCKKNPGDLRYSMIYYISKPMAGGPLGYGPSEADPETGEIINATANIYGAALTIYKERAMEFFDIVYYCSRDGISDEQCKNYIQSIAEGEDIRGYFVNMYGTGVQPMGPENGPWKPTDIVKSKLDNLFAKVKASGARTEEDIARLLTDKNTMTAISARKANVLKNHPDLEKMMLFKDLAVVKGGIKFELADGEMTDEVVDYISPLREHWYDKVKAFHRSEYLKGRYHCILEPNEYIDDGVLFLVKKYADKGWTREQIAELVYTAIYRGVTEHEIGHTLGLRHMFEGSFDAKNFPKEWWDIYKKVKASDPEFANFEFFNVPVFANEAQYNDYLRVWDKFRKKMREEGAYLYQLTSIMDYGAQFYTDGFVGIDQTDFRDANLNLGEDIWGEKYPTSNYSWDVASIKFGYGLREIIRNGHKAVVSVAEKWDGAPDESKNYQNKVDAVFYVGGENCASDDDCPFKDFGQTCLTGICMRLDRGNDFYLGGERCSKDSDCPGYVKGQKCGAAPTVPKVCSHFYQNRNYGSDANNFVKYRFCSDERTDDLPFCNRWDEGVTSREIVVNEIDLYNKNYIFNNFKRYRRNFGFDYDARVFGRYFVTIGKQYQAMLYQYFYEPGMRSPSNWNIPGGLNDMYIASTVGLNFFNKVLGEPDVGCYTYVPGTKYLKFRSSDPEREDCDLRLRLGEAKYYWHKWEGGYYGRIYRISIIGTVIDKIMALDALTTRDWGFPEASGIRFYINYYDFFQNELIDIVAGLINEDYHKYAWIAENNAGNWTLKPRNIWYGDNLTGRELPERNQYEVYKNSNVIEPGVSVYNQIYGMAFAIDRFSVFFDTTFFNFMKICIEGQECGYTPYDPSVKCEYKSLFNPYTYYGARVFRPVASVNVDRSIGCAAIDRANMYKDAYNTHTCMQKFGEDDFSCYYRVNGMESVLNMMMMFMQDYYGVSGL